MLTDKKKTGYYTLLIGRCFLSSVTAKAFTGLTVYWSITTGVL